ncbi:hypothetical protein AB0D67_34055 [Streptosporangium sp. NPDC048047]|uniref:hypothetical protein n=1 Tax=Streptosporangium sp. NPDC048047 TaxID=3155748 RepID=UPI0034328E2E
MRRWVVLAAAVLTGVAPVATSPAAAQADAPDPVRAIKRQLRGEHGVRISETDRFHYGAKSTVSGSGTRITGRLRLAPSGPVAADLTWRGLPAPKAGKPAKPGEQTSHRMIRVGENTYDDAAHYPGGPVPEGKKWIRFPEKHRGSANRDMARDASLQPIDLYDTSLMKTLLKCSKRERVSGGLLYRGTLSRKELGRLSGGAFVDWASGRLVGAKSKGKVSWRLWTDRTGLPKRLLTTDTVGEGKNALVKRSDTRYTGWGSRLVITAPPADEVIDEADLLEYVRERNEPIPEDSGNT